MNNKLSRFCNYYSRLLALIFVFGQGVVSGFPLFIPGLLLIHPYSDMYHITLLTFHILPVFAIDITMPFIKFRVKLETTNACPEYLLTYISKTLVLTSHEMIWTLVVVKVSVEILRNSNLS